MDGKPDLVIGNYTDGNLVASLVANKLGITQVLSLTSLLFHIGMLIFSLIVHVNYISKNASNGQGTIAHALEKTKYEDSDLKWKELDPKYHFSCQFLADTISMNASDFVIASTFQEIAGRLEFSYLIKFTKF